jgi:hypothetical protein
MPSVKFTEQEKIVWSAGILEGEGCFSIRKDKRRGGLIYFNVSCGMTDRDVVDRLAEFLGGEVGGPYVRKGNRKVVFRWDLSVRSEVKSFLEKVLPYMGGRRSEKIRLMLNEMEKHPTIREYKKWLQHGSVNMYYRAGCRCDECIAGKEKRLKRDLIARQSKRSKATCPV